VRTRKKFLALAAVAVGVAAVGITESSATSPLPQADSPIQHLVVIYDENVSFDHYFGTYPAALNPSNEPQFDALSGTPTVNGLNTSLLDANPNEFDPERLDRSQALTCDQNHGYTAEQEAYDGGLMDKFVQFTQGSASSNCTQHTEPDSGSYGPPGIVMDYYDGNTVTGLWNLAQHFSLNDNSYSTQFGPSTPGAINLIAGQTAGAVSHGGASSSISSGSDSSDTSGTLYGDGEPYYDDCSNSTTAWDSADHTYQNAGSPGGVTVSMTGQNIGNLMNNDGMTWGWFQGGFTPSGGANTNGSPTTCGTTHTNIGGATVADYSEHHEPFQYYASTANPDHVAPSSVTQVGYSDAPSTPLDLAVNHQYDASWFFQALAAHNMPQVSFLKAPEYEDGHAGYSDPLDEQRWLANTIDTIEQSSYWPNTAIVIAYDDSDGWYDHQMGPIITPSQDAGTDALDGAGICGSAATAPTPPSRCGVGPRQPLLVISPWAKQNYVDDTFTDQSSILQFIEQNWNLGAIGGSADTQAGTLDNMFDFNGNGDAPAIIMDPNTGEITKVIYSNGHTYTPPQNATDTSAFVPQGGIGGGSSESSGTSGSGTSGSSSQSSTAGGNESSSAGTSGDGGSNSNSSSGLTLSCKGAEKDGKWVLTCTTGSTDGAVVLRARMFRGNSLRANVAKSLRGNKARFAFGLAHGTYRLVLSIDDAGKVSELVEHVKIG
jgi:phospholipase C